jgi:hypothetical protein
MSKRADTHILVIPGSRMDNYQGNGSRISGYDSRYVSYFLDPHRTTDTTPFCSRHHDPSPDSSQSPLYRPTSANLRGMGHQRSETTGGAGSLYDEMQDYADRDDDSGKGGLSLSGYRRARAG